MRRYRVEVWLLDELVDGKRSRVFPVRMVGGWDLLGDDDLDAPELVRALAGELPISGPVELDGAWPNLPDGDGGVT